MTNHQSRSDSRTVSRIMRISRPNSPTGRTEVVVLTADKNFDAQARQTFGASDQIALRVASGALSALGDNFEVAGRRWRWSTSMRVARKRWRRSIN